MVRILLAVLLCDPALAALARPPSRGGGRRREQRQAADGPAPLWEYRDADWSHKGLPQEARQPTGGRSRAARREEFYQTLRGYSEHFAPLIQSEFDEEQRVRAVGRIGWP